MAEQKKETASASSVASHFGEPVFTPLGKPARKAKKGSDMYRDLADVFVPIMGPDGKPSKAVGVRGSVTARQVNGEGKWQGSFRFVTVFYKSAIIADEAQVSALERSIMDRYVAWAKDTGNKPSTVPDGVVELDL